MVLYAGVQKMVTARLRRAVFHAYEIPRKPIRETKNYTIIMNSHEALGSYGASTLKALLSVRDNERFNLYRHFPSSPEDILRNVCVLIEPLSELGVSKRGATSHMLIRKLYDADGTLRVTDLASCPKETVDYASALLLLINEVNVAPYAAKDQNGPGWVPLEVLSFVRDDPTRWREVSAFALSRKLRLYEIDADHFFSVRGSTPAVLVEGAL